MKKNRSAVSLLCHVPNPFGFARNAGGSSSLHTRMNCGARLMQPLRCAATNLKTSNRFLHHARVKHTARASTGTTSAAHSTSRAPLQQHLHFLHATPRHTLHHHLSPAPRHEGHVHIGRRSSQSLARERHTGEHEAHSPTRTTWNKNGSEGRQRLLPTVLPAWRSLSETTHCHVHELKRALDLRAKLCRRLQLAIGDDGK